MTSIIKVDQIQKTDGSAFSFGGVVAVYKAFSNTMQTITSTSLTNITDLSITMTPKDANNLLVMQSVVSSSLYYVNSLTILKDGAKTVTTTQTNDNEADTHVTYYEGAASTGYIMPIPVMHYETAGSTSSRTYTVAATSGWSGGAYSMMINNRPGSDMAATSWFTIMEIAQ